MLYNILNKNRKTILIIVDFFIAIITYLSAYVMSGMYNENAIAVKLGFFFKYFWLYALIYVVTFIYMGIYKNMCRYAGIEEIYRCLLASAIANTTFLAISLLFNLSVRYYVYYVIYPVSTLGSISIRIIYRALLIIRKKENIQDGTNIIIIGAGDATYFLLKELKTNSHQSYVAKCILDDDVGKIGRNIEGVLVAGNTSNIQKYVRKYNAKEIILSIPSIDAANKKRIIDLCTQTKCKLKIIPEIISIINNKETDIVNKIRDIEMEDLLGRKPVVLDCSLTRKYIKNKTVLVTGGGGSIGSELCRQIASYEPKKLIILDIYENNAYDIQQELIRKYQGRLNLKIKIASVRDLRKLEQIFVKEEIDIVFHAAAHKHVPLMEDDPEEAIKNNVIGTYNVAYVSDKYEVDKFVLISTDKAVNPTNIMGATKRIAELIIQSFNKASNTDYVAVRFGNVLGSNGSVVPLFVKQIKEGGPVTITHPEITRFFMTIPEAVQLVLKAGSLANVNSEFFYKKVKKT